MRRLPALLACALPITLFARSAVAQQPKLERPPRVGSDSVVTAADSGHAAGPVHRFFFGSGYRDLWVKPIKVPVLDLTPVSAGRASSTSCRRC